LRAAQLASKSPSFYVTIVTSGGSTTKKIDGDLLTVGRADDCHLTIAHDTLSRRHLSITMKDGECFVEDHGSSNGTFLNGKKIKSHSLTRLKPTDEITMGQAGVKISASPEAVMPAGGALPPIPKSEKTAAAEEGDTIVTSTSLQRQSLRVAPPPVESKNQSDAIQQAEQLVIEAQKKAAAMIQEAETEAERRVEDIYRRAHETQSKMDEIYQRRVNEAYRASEQVFQKSNEKSEEILEVARKRANEIREQAESFVAELRRRTEDECERMLSEARDTARDLKENRMLEAEEMIRKKEEELVTRAREAMNDRMARFEKDLLNQWETEKKSLQTELGDRRAQFERDHQEQMQLVEKLKAEAQRLIQLKSKEQAELTQTEETLRRRRKEVEENQARGLAVTADLDHAKGELKELRRNVETLKEEQDKAERETAEAKKDLAKAHEERLKAQSKLQKAQGESEAKLAAIQSDFESKRSQLELQENSHLEQRKLESTQRAQAYERQLMEELTILRERISRELTLHVEAHLKANPQGPNRRALEDMIGRHLNEQIATLGQGQGANAKAASLIKLKKREKIRVASVSALVGGALVFAFHYLQPYLMTGESPLQRRVAEQQEARRKDLEKRKFQPALTPGYKSTYVDNVVYTENFSTTYLSDEFQRRYFQALAPFMLKTWRTDEDRVIQLLAMATTLVKALDEKRVNIHPDFVRQGLEKMREVEMEANGRMRVLLGSQVRVESFKKFERQFYENYAPQGGG